MGWRYQIPMLVDMGLRVVAPDCLGYGRTVSKSRMTILWENIQPANRVCQSKLIHKKDAPDDYHHYSHKRCANDIKALATHLGSSKIILGGHDW